MVKRRKLWECKWFTMRLRVLCLATDITMFEYGLCSWIHDRAADAKNEKAPLDRVVEIDMFKTFGVAQAYDTRRYAKIAMGLR